MSNTKELNRLITHTEELLSELADERDPQVRETRDRVEQSLQETRRAVTEQGAHTRVKIRDVASSLDDYVRDYPWLALGTGILFAATIGLLAVGATRRAWGP
jgi:ElaB/YqjD/DUF883 family membrane-anchored ribosome-binding protein